MEGEVEREGKGGREQRESEIRQEGGGKYANRGE